jgi:pilus assembly protein Flp/PilA
VGVWLARVRFCLCERAISTGERILMNEGRFIADMRNLLSEFIADERGVSAIEYGLLAVGIVVAIIAAAAALGTSLDATSSEAANPPN